MSNLLGGEKQTPEELEKIRQVRTDYQNNLSQGQVFVNELSIKKQSEYQTKTHFHCSLGMYFDWN